MNFKGFHTVSVRDFSREDIEHVLDLADGMVPIARGEKSSSLMKVKIMATAKIFWRANIISVFLFFY